MRNVTKVRILALMMTFLLAQGCQEEDVITESVTVLSEAAEKETEEILDELTSVAKEWFDKAEENSSQNARGGKNKKRNVEPQWQLANKSQYDSKRTIVIVPALMEGFLHNNVQLITFQENSEVKLGFFLEIAPDSLYREEHGLEVGPDFQGRMKVYDKE